MGACPLFNGRTFKNLTMQVISGSMCKNQKNNNKKIKKILLLCSVLDVLVSVPGNIYYSTGVRILEPVFIIVLIF